MRTCGQDFETIHFLLHYLHHQYARKTLLQKIYQIKGNSSRQSDSTITKILLFSENKLNFETEF